MGISGGAAYNTDPPPEQKAAARRSAARDVAALMVKELGVAIDPEELRRFLQNHWSHVSRLAHRVHDGRG